jgi:tetratricopeptide (TPR) repeat protein
MDTSRQQRQDQQLDAPAAQLRDVADILLELGHTLIMLGDDLAATGHSAAAQRRYDEAAQAFHNAIRESPNSADLYLELARARVKQGQADEALNLFVEAVRLAPEQADIILPEAHQWLTPARAPGLGSRLHGTLQPLLENRELTPDDAGALYTFLGRTYLYLNDYKRARNYYERALNVHRDVYCIEGLGQVFFEKGELQEAEALLREAVALADDAPQAGRQAATRLKLAKTLLSMGVPDEAKKVALAALEFRGGEKTAAFHTLLGEVYLALSRPEEAIRHSDQALAAERTLAAAYYVRAEAFRMIGRYEEALAEAEKTLEINPRHANAVLVKAQALLHRSPPDWEQAMRLLPLYARAYPDKTERTYNLLVEEVAEEVRAEAHLHLARLWQREQQLTPALAAVDEAIQHGLTGEPEVAAYELKAALLAALERPNAERAEAHFQAGQLRYWREEYRVAVDLLSLAYELDPGNPQIGWLLSDTLRVLAAMLYSPEQSESERKRVLPEQEQLLQRGVEVWEHSTTQRLPVGGDAWVYVVRALLLEELTTGQPENRQTFWWEAMVYLERSLLHSPDNAYAYAYLARYFRYHQLEANAIHAIRRALELDPGVAVILEEASAIFALAGLHEEALELMADTPENSQNWWAMGVKAYAFYQSGQMDRALGVLEEVLTDLGLNSHTVWIHDLWAVCLMMTGKVEEAQEKFRLIWQARSDDPGNQAFFAWSAYELGKYDEAMRRNKLLLQSPDDSLAVISANLGLAYLAIGDIQSGRDYMETALKVSGGFSGPRHVRYRDLIQHDLEALVARVAGTVHEDAVREVAAWTRQEAKVRLEALEMRPTPAEELQQLNVPFTPVQADGSVAWMVYAVPAALGRLYTEAGDHEQARAIYQQLYEWSTASDAELPPFPDAEWLVKGETELGAEAALTMADVRSSALEVTEPDVNTVLRGLARAREFDLRTHFQEWYASGRPSISADFDRAIKEAIIDNDEALEAYSHLKGA